MAHGYRDIADSLSEGDKKILDHALEVMYTNGFADGYIIANNNQWVLAGKDTPNTKERVDVTVELPGGKRIVSHGRFIDGKWTGYAANHGTVVAWRPQLEPYKAD